MVSGCERCLYSNLLESCAALPPTQFCSIFKQNQFDCCTLGSTYQSKQAEVNLYNYSRNKAPIGFKGLVVELGYLNSNQKDKRQASIRFGLWPFLYYITLLWVVFFFLSLLSHAARAPSRQWNPEHKWRGCVWSWSQADGVTVFREKCNAYSENEPLRDPATLMCVLVRWGYFQGPKEFAAPSKPVTAPGRVSR